MKHLLLLLSFIALFASFIVAIHASGHSDTFLNANVEALANREIIKNDGALWSNAAGTRYCCGPGNVRDCSKETTPDCGF